MDFGDGVNDRLTDSPTPKPRTRFGLGSLPPLEPLQDIGDEITENRTPRKKKKKSNLSRLKDKTASNGTSNKPSSDIIESSSSKIVSEATVF